jgi:hypothetical protein
MRGGSGKRSSPLDSLRPREWTAAMTEQLLGLLWCLEASLEIYPSLESRLGSIIQEPWITIAELPSPLDSERVPPERTAQPMQFEFGS